MALSVTSGLTLFEVLVSMLLLSLLLLGLEGMTLSAFSLNQKAYYAALAEQQLYNMEERLRLIGSFEEKLDQQLELWNEENKRLLPQGWGWLDGHYPEYSLTLSWGKKEKQNCLSERIIL
ncbi:MAG TPA: hypothetical protein VLH77_02995 [Gammaproteobacteria bacterium]|nr:hypothetical protein [Gammaproteobacteria bacterium]